jgi:hypothetical protein
VGGEFCRLDDFAEVLEPLAVGVVLERGLRKSCGCVGYQRRVVDDAVCDEQGL